MKRRVLAAMALGMALSPSWVLAQGQAFPSKPVKFIVPYAAGGLPDSVARIVAQKLTERLGQSFVIDNKPGGNGVVSYQNLVSAPNDGYTFIVQRKKDMMIVDGYNVYPSEVEAALYTHPAVMEAAARINLM